MPRVTEIRSSPRSPRRRTIVLDGLELRATSAAVVRTIGLAVGDDVDAEALLRDIAFAEHDAVRERALRLLAYREHSERELATKLADDGYPAELAGELVADLRRMDLVDDARFAASLASTLVTGRGLGRRRALAELKRHGLDEALAGAALDALAPAETELDRALELARRWAPRTPDARKLAAKLIRRGFSPRASFDAAETALDAQDADFPPLEP